MTSTNHPGNRARIAIIGAGVSGLTTANLLQQLLEPEADVTILADDLSMKIVSYVAGGIFGPDPLICNNASQNFKWAKQTFDYFKSLLNQQKNQPTEQDTGVRMVRGYALDTNPELDTSCDQVMSMISPYYRKLSEDELCAMLPHAQQGKNGKKLQHGYEFDTIITDPHVYLPYLKQRFLERGQLLQRKLQLLNNSADVAYLAQEFDVVVNCAGLNAGQLVHDTQLKAIRGQTISAYGVWVPNFYCIDGYYIFPECNGRMLMGGIKQFGNCRKEVCEFDRSAIWRNCTHWLPELANATRTIDAVGLRPFRTQVCIGRQQIHVQAAVDAAPSGKSTTVCCINNYGHGGNGFSYSYGTALEAVKLVLECLREKGFSVKLKQDLV